MTGSQLVTLPDSALNPLELAEDMGFSEEAVEVSAIRNFDDDIYLVTRYSSSAEFMVHAGHGAGPPWVQIGPKMIETPSDMTVIGGEVFLLRNRADVAGLDCLSIPAGAGPGGTWMHCRPMMTSSRVFPGCVRRVSL